MIQEPPVHTLSDPCFLPLFPSSTQHFPFPRAITYVNKRIALTTFHQVSVPDTGDVVAINLQTLDGTIQLINIYNPNNSTRTLQIVQPLLVSPLAPPMLLIAGDWNAHHPHWTPGNLRMNQAGRFAHKEILQDESEFSLLLPLYHYPLQHPQRRSERGIDD